MKSLRILYFFLFLSLSVGCKKNKAITYDNFSSNILQIDESTTLISGEAYTMSASLGKKAKLKIVLTNLSTTSAIWFYSLGSDKNWQISDYSGVTQEFYTDETGISSVTMFFELGVGSQGGPGSCRVDYYENSSSITRSKILYW
jgi:hypothetical protein|tara:strand:+ start:40469 stop:40900 length:432 start_codon:yes stop_codon:yes gene_type:complete